MSEMRNAQTSMAGRPPCYGAPAEEMNTVHSLLTEAGMGSMTGLNLEWLLDRVESRGLTP